MPAKSKAQQATAAIALHGDPEPGTPAAKMKKSMKKTELRKFASTPKKDLPQHVKKKVTESIEPMHVQFVSPQARAEYMGDGIVETELQQLPEGAQLVYIIHDPIEPENRMGPETEALREVYVTSNARVIDKNITFDGPYELLTLKLNSLSKYFRRYVGETMSTITFKDYIVEQAQLNEMGKRFGRKPEGAPRVPEHIRDVAAGRKGGAHYNEKTDFKRAKEKAKFLRDKYASEYEEMCSSEYEEEIDMRVEPGATDVDFDGNDDLTMDRGDTREQDMHSDTPEFESYDDWKQSARDVGLIVRFDRQNNLCTATTREGDIMGEFDHNTDDGWLNDTSMGSEVAQRSSNPERDYGDSMYDEEHQDDLDLTSNRIGSDEFDQERSPFMRESFTGFLNKENKKG